MLTATNEEATNYLNSAIKYSMAKSVMLRSLSVSVRLLDLPTQIDIGKSFLKIYVITSRSY